MGLFSILKNSVAVRIVVETPAWVHKSQNQRFTDLLDV